MTQKGVIRRIPKYRIQGYLNHNEEIVIQACLDAQIREWLRQDHQIYEKCDCKKENELSIILDSDDFIDLNSHRLHRSKGRLLNVYLIKELAFLMFLIDATLILVSQLYLNWSPHYTFQRGICSFARMFLNLHVLYCLSVFMIEKHKEHHENIKC